MSEVIHPRVERNSLFMVVSLLLLLMTSMFITSSLSQSRPNVCEKDNCIGPKWKGGTGDFQINGGRGDSVGPCDEEQRKICTESIVEAPETVFLLSMIIAALSGAVSIYFFALSSKLKAGSFNDIRSLYYGGLIAAIFQSAIACFLCVIMIFSMEGLSDACPRAGKEKCLEYGRSRFNRPCNRQVTANFGNGTSHELMCFYPGPWSAGTFCADKAEQEDICSAFTHARATYITGLTFAVLITICAGGMLGIYIYCAIFSTPPGAERVDSPKSTYDSPQAVGNGGADGPSSPPVPFTGDIA